MSFLFRDKTAMPEPGDALPGRDERPFHVPETHYVLRTPLEPPFPEGVETAIPIASDPPPDFTKTSCVELPGATAIESAPSPDPILQVSGSVPSLPGHAPG